ncbi:hypothetical protein [Acidovorax sp.]|uniref:hypothetical protein n=1 Tax=Acidovorax sp. TaxID=1872122 RepID=UPI0025C6123D|nr:hypothetical protein [Acidovorax sp.]
MTLPKLLKRSDVQAFIWLVGGALLGIAAWGLYRTPLLAVMLPVLCFMAPRRACVFALALGYHLATVRFLPEYLLQWFSNYATAVLGWLALGIVSASVWTLCWTASEKRWRVALAAASGFVLSLLPPFAVVLPGHPLVGWGFVMGGKHWFGVVFAIFITAYVATEIRVARSKAPRWLVPYVAAMVIAGLGWGSFFQRQGDGREVQDTVAIHSGWGKPPTSQEQVIERIESVARIAKATSELQDRPRLLVFPETTLGRYDVTFGPVLRAELGSHVTAAGQSIVLGAEIDQPDGTAQNLAVVLRRDGTSDYIKQRQPALLSMWAPWKETGHFPADWLGNNILKIEDGLQARVIICYEEWIPALHLLNEALHPHNLVIAMANAWAAPSLTATQIQANHTEGMARLFGRKHLRAENYQPAMAKERRAYEAEQAVPPR